MKNIPRIYIDAKLETGATVPVSKEVVHYLTKVMRTNKCLVFNDGIEYNAELVTGHGLLVTGTTERPDPAGSVVLAFAPIKKTDDLINMATQMGVARFQPVITDRTVAHHINWERMRKIAIEASEQSGRNSVPDILPAVKFGEFIRDQLSVTSNQLIFADERFAHDMGHGLPVTGNNKNDCVVFVGPEGGFSDAEFAALDAHGATPLSLGKTILRAEVAAVAAIAKLRSLCSQVN